MPYDPSIFNINPYYDDFDGEKGFLRVLFKPGYAVQARELTQLQTILQDQFSKIGDHLFKDGSRIVGGGISVRNSSYVMVSVETGSPLRGLDDYSFLVGGELRSNFTTTRAKIVHYLPPDTTDGNLVLIVDFVSGTSFGTDFLSFYKDETVIDGITVRSGVTYSVEGPCKLVSVSDGIFYVDGFFVRVASSSYAPYETLTTHRGLSFAGFTTLSKRIGFSINRDAITDDNDSTLRDPAIGSYNYNAPGADRYKITLSLSQTELDESVNDFLELLRFEEGKVTKKIDRISYGEIQKALARRTFDESGSYTVKAFDITAKALSDSQLSLSVGKGKAYVLGYEVENQYPLSVALPKARTTQSQPATRYPFTTGNYSLVTMSAASDIGQTFATNLQTISSGSARVVYRSAENGTVVAEGYVHGAIPHPASVATAGLTGMIYRLYQYGVSGSFAFAASGSIYQHGTGFTIGSIVSIDPAQTLVMPNESSLVFEIKPGYAVNEITDLSVPAKIVGDVAIPVTVTNSGSTTTYSFSKSHFANTISTANASAFGFFPYGSAGYNSVDASDISFVRSADGAAFTPNSGTISNSNDTVTLSVANAPAGFTSGTLRAFAPILYTPDFEDASTFRTKTSTAVTVNSINSATPSVDENGRLYFQLPYYDVYSVTSVTFTTGSPAVTTDVTEDFELDDGQRESYYDYARLYIKRDRATLARYTDTASSVLLTVSCSYFAHGGLASAPFIGKHSYVNIGYESIPLYVNPKTGKTVSLANCLDFRRTGKTSTTLMFKPYGRSEFGILGDTEIAYTHYLPRVDKLCVKADPEDGSALFFLASGTPDLAPVAPPDPADALVLATITVPAFTHDTNSVVITPIDSKRYTMEDMGKIEKRVDEVEVFTKLSLSESEIESRSLKTSVSAVEPLKTSILVDEFYGHSVADVVDGKYSCSIDYERGELRPFFTATKVALPAPEYINSVVSSDGLATLQYSETNYIANNQYSTTVQINPSNTVNWLGFMSLSSAVDSFYDPSYRPVVKTNALKENDNWLSSNSNNSR